MYETDYYFHHIFSDSLKYNVFNKYLVFKNDVLRTLYQKQTNPTHRFMFSQPGVEQGLVPDSVQGGHHHVGGGHLVRLHLNLGHLGAPGHPITGHGHLRKYIFNIV